MNILDQIVEHKKQEVAGLHRNVTPVDFKTMEFYDRPTISLQKSLTTKQPFTIIAEFKRSSPSAKTIRQSASPTEIAIQYEKNGAAGISVLTDEKYFSGNVHDLSSARKAVSLPLLRKDFIIDSLQLYEAKAYGADAILLIASILEKMQLRELHMLATELNLECLVELYGEDDLDKVDFSSMKLIGVNNRDLRTFSINVNRTITMSKRIPDDVTLVSESGIHSSSDIRFLLDANIHCALIGEHFMKSDNPGHALKQMLENI